MKRATPFSPVLTAVWLAVGCDAAALDAVVGPPRVLTDALIAHWTFDEGSGAIATDDSGNGHDAQLTTGTWIPDGRFAGAWRLGLGDSAAVSSFPHATPNWSVSVWVRLSTDQLAADSEPWATVLSTENLSAGGWVLNLDNNKPPNPRFVFSYWAPPSMRGYIVTECVCVETNSWIHLAAVIDVEANVVRLYRDGIVSEQKARLSDVLPGDTTLHFGRWNMGGRLLAGDLDDVAIWGRALTAAEIAALTKQSPGRLGAMR